MTNNANEPHPQAAPGPGPDAEASTEPQAASAPERGITRRSLIVGGGVTAAAALVGGFFAGRAFPYPGTAPTPSPTPEPKGWRSYHTSEAQAPRVSTWKSAQTASGHLFVDPKDDVFNGMIMDDAGEPIWIEPTRADLTDLRVQRFEGEPVLTYWSGKSVAYHGEGSGTILDTSYRPVATVNAGNGLKADLHEFNLTDRGTALITAYGTASADLSAIGGPKEGYVFTGHVQEIDVRTGEVLLDWNSLDHVPVTETHQAVTFTEGHDGSSPEHAFDYFHVNGVDDDGDALLISARHTWCVYRIDRTSGAVLWRFGGKHSDISVPEHAVFSWQHDVRRQPDGSISLYDNHVEVKTKGEASRGMVFRLDESARSAKLLHEYAYGGHTGTAMGSTQLLENGHVLVTWGTDPALTEFTRDGEAVYEMSGLGKNLYRGWRGEWHARPRTKPAVAVERGGAGGSNDDRMLVHVSWNGATDVHRWRVLAGPDARRLAVARTARRAGFETSIETPAHAAVRVEALDAGGRVLGASAVVTS
ncbi:arylsulfotransferase family protein [Microbacterium sp. STN6]|uniref:arylsulfotransferase family protein n=1 Tax=Microbacterium sp. STN6 TaxID=2995588 RepID=UPI0022608CF2|nr:arylsulfotransferase family protein [Microbacterium sp. STN6]MCX7521756.1 arylsulfotransferase family protein [Microbacterium sp. STN6]